MTESDVHTGTVGRTAEVQRLRNRITELETQVRANEPELATHTTSSGTKVAAALAGLTALMAVPTFITVRRWVRWWA